MLCVCLLEFYTTEPSESDALCSLLCISPGSYLTCVILLPLLQVVSVKSEKLIDWMAAGFRTCWVFDYFSGRERIVCSKSFCTECIAGPVLHRLPRRCSCAGLLIQLDYKENMPFIVKNGITSPLQLSSSVMG